jgi:hypothetical protein
MGSSAWVRLFGLVLGVGAGCNIAGQPCGWLNLSACDSESTTSGAGGNMCAGFGGYGGEGGAGGDDEGAGGDGSSGSGLGGNFGVSVGVGGGSFGDAVGASVGAGAGDGRSSGDEGHVARGPRHRGHRGGLGTAQQAGCGISWNFPSLPPPIPLPASAVTLSTTRLRFICTAQNIGNGATGIQFNNACGLQFEAWVLWTLQQQPNKTPIPSMERQLANSKIGGKPAAVIPDYLIGLNVIDRDTGVTLTYSKSTFGEVKAVTGNLTLGYSQWQILGLIDVARLSPPRRPSWASRRGSCSPPRGTRRSPVPRSRRRPSGAWRSGRSSCTRSPPRRTIRTRSYASAPTRSSTTGSIRRVSPQGHPGPPWRAAR